MADDVVIASELDLEAILAPLARAKRMVLFAALLGVGKSLFIRELARAAHMAGRTVHLLQWDVARPAFVTPAIDARYPERDGVIHVVIQKAIGQWARGAVMRWNREHDATHILIGEVPLIGNRLLDLAQVQADDVEPLLAGPIVLRGSNRARGCHVVRQGLTLPHQFITMPPNLRSTGPAGPCVLLQCAGGRPFNLAVRVPMVSMSFNRE